MTQADAVSRGQFFGFGAKGAVALVAGGTLLAQTTGTAFAADTRVKAVDDVAIAKLAATAELLAIDFYGRAIKSGKFKGDQLGYLAAAQTNEQDHYAALAKVLGSAAPKGLKFKYPAGTFDSVKSMAGIGVALETAFVGAYLGAVTAFKNPKFKGVAATIGANEAQHLTIFKQIGAGALVSNPSFPGALTAAKATAAVTPFLA